MRTVIFECEATSKVTYDNYVIDYCQASAQSFYRTIDVIESYDRTEMYLVSNSKLIAAVFMAHYIDMHHGDVGGTLALFIMPEHRGKPHVSRWVNTMITDWCKENGIKKYQRSKHIDSNRQLIITKEV